MNTSSVLVTKDYTAGRKLTFLFIDGYLWLALLLGLLTSGMLVMQTTIADGLVWPGLHWYSAWYLVLASPVAEEWFFRGVMQPLLLEIPSGRLGLRGLTFANLITSLMFACVHIPTQSMIWAGLVLFPSLIFGWFRDRYNHMAPAVLLHVFYNLFFFYFLGSGR